MLLDDFFTIIDLEKTDESVISNIKIDPSHKIFEGHFPGNPITPGVVQVQLVKEILEKAGVKILGIILNKVNLKKIRSRSPKNFYDYKYHYDHIENS